MPTDGGTVTGVGVSSIQFYIPLEVSGHEDCPFEANDDFEVRTLEGHGLLLTPPDESVAVDDLLAAFDDYQLPQTHD